jgi:NADH-quinone oxidoreductase subunit H
MDWLLLLEWVIKCIVLIFVLLGGFAYLTWFERRVLARMQVRIGPNRAGWQGLLQPVADAIKLIFKEELIPDKAERFIFILAPILAVAPAVIITATVPWGPDISLKGIGIPYTIKPYIADINVGVLYITAIASIAVYGIVLAGWSSDNKFSMLGGLRATAQMISYELSLGLSLVAVILLTGSMNMNDVVTSQSAALLNLGFMQIPMWNAFVQPVAMGIFMIATLAELNRAPFDMPEAEQELTAGYMTEYSGMKFALFFMGEYTKMIAISAIAATLFFGGYLGPFVGQFPILGPIYLFIKIVAVLFWMVWVRATWPRIRYDRLMSFGWKVMLPLSLAVVMITAIGIVLGVSLGPGTGPLVQGIFTCVLSLLVAFLFTLAIDRALRRKLYA